MLAEFYFDEYLKRFGNAQNADYITYLKLQSRYYGIKNSSKDQEFFSNSLGAFDNFLDRFPTSRYVPFVQSMQVRFVLGQNELNKCIVNVYTKQHKQEAAQKYLDRIDDELESSTKPTPSHIPWYVRMLTGNHKILKYRQENLRSFYAEHPAIPISLPVLIEEDFIYPFAIAPIFTQGERNIKAANAALDRNDLLIVCCQKPEDFGASKHEAQDHVQATAQSNSLAQVPFYDVGVVCKILRKVSLPDGRVKILVQGMALAKITALLTPQNPGENAELFASLSRQKLILSVIRSMIVCAWKR